MTDTASLTRVQRDLVEFFARWDTPPLLRPLFQLIAEGDPVRLDRLAAAAGLPLAQVESRLRAEPGVDWDDQGRLVGFGLTQRPTRHRFILGGRTLYAFCGPDTLNLPAMLGVPATVESTCAATGQPIRIEITPEQVERIDPATAVVAVTTLDFDLTGGPDRTDAEVCSQQPFFSAPEAAADWVAAHPQGRLIPVRDFHAEARQLVDWLERRPASSAG